jgi:hypothetical protein
MRPVPTMRPLTAPPRRHLHHEEGRALRRQDHRLRDNQRGDLGAAIDGCYVKVSFLSKLWCRPWGAGFIGRGVGGPPLPLVRRSAVRRSIPDLKPFPVQEFRASACEAGRMPAPQQRRPAVPEGGHLARLIHRDTSVLETALIRTVSVPLSLTPSLPVVRVVGVDIGPTLLLPRRGGRNRWGRGGENPLPSSTGN